MTRRQKFWLTKEHKRFAEFCDACRQYRYIGLCYGVPGVGKTLSARRYTYWDQIDYCLEYFPDRWAETIPQLPVNKLLSMLYTPNVVHTPQQVRNQIRDLRTALWIYRDHHLQALYPHEGYDQRMKHIRKRELLIVDEADRLSMQGFEEMRDIYDRFDLSIVLIGMPGIEKRLARFPQLYSRIGFVHQFRNLGPTEILPIVEFHWKKTCQRPLNHQTPQHLEAYTTIVSITNGNFRLIDRLFAQIERILKINQLHEINQEIIQVAREGLVIGSIL